MAQRKKHDSSPAKFDVVSFGETMLRFTPIGSRLEDANQFTSHVAGTEANTLVGLARLGLDVAWVSALPQNPPGYRVASELRNHGVNIDYIQWDEETARLGIFYAEELPSPIGTKVYYDRAHSAFAETYPPVWDLSVIDSAKLVHLTGITPALSVNAYQLFENCLARAGEVGVPVSFDTNYRHKLWLWREDEAPRAMESACRQARLLFVPMGDAEHLWNFTGSPKEVLKQLADRFAEKGKEKTIIVTCGSDGSAHWDNGAFHHEPAFPTEGTVRFGSGDAFTAGYLSYWMGRWKSFPFVNIELNPLKVGNAMAALKRCIPGDLCVVAPDELISLLTKSSARFR
jgi:2-dehydro-3-deoxygluconokinase